MRILDIDPDNHEASIESGRAVVRSEIEHPAKTVVLIRGKGGKISLFADRAASRCDTVNWREAIWVRDSEIFPEGWEKRFFGADTIDQCCAVVIGDSDQAERKLDVSMSGRIIEKNISQVEAAEL
jgi:hypothetical protein